MVFIEPHISLYQHICPLVGIHSEELHSAVSK